MQAAAERYAELQSFSRDLLAGTLLVLGIAVLTFSFRRVGPELRARNRVENVIEFVLIGASMIAILTTIGIFLSVLFESLRFSGVDLRVPVRAQLEPADRDPRGSGRLIGRVRRRAAVRGHAADLGR